MVINTIRDNRTHVNIYLNCVHRYHFWIAHHGYSTYLYNNNHYYTIHKAPYLLYYKNIHIISNSIVTIIRNIEFYAVSYMDNAKYKSIKVVQIQD